MKPLTMKHSTELKRLLTIMSVGFLSCMIICACKKTETISVKEYDTDYAVFKQDTGCITNNDEFKIQLPTYDPDKYQTDNTSVKLALDKLDVDSIILDFLYEDVCFKISIKKDQATVACQRWTHVVVNAIIPSVALRLTELTDSLFISKTVPVEIKRIRTPNGGVWVSSEPYIGIEIYKKGKTTRKTILWEIESCEIIFSPQFEELGVLMTIINRSA